MEEPCVFAEDMLLLCHCFVTYCIKLPSLNVSSPKAPSLVKQLYQSVCQWLLYRSVYLWIELICKSLEVLGFTRFFRLAFERISTGCPL